MKTIKIMIADDHQMFIDGIKALLLTNKGYLIVGEAKNGKQVLDVLGNIETDIILMDVNMPVLDGIETTKQVIKKYPKVKVLMLTMFNTRDYIEKVLKAGAHGYILKNTGKEELQEAISKLMEGESYFSKEVTEKIMQGLQRIKETQNDPMNIELTEREKDVLKWIVEELTTLEIAEKLFISHHTVETHRKNLVSKLNVKNTAGLVKYAIKNGIVNE
jgi:two-component system, NarL family, nitrate/nitrite response regulator NarL